MSCKLCASEQLLDFPTELSFNFPDIDVAAVYLCHRVLVCANCGYAELVIPVSQLEQLKRGMGESPNGNGRHDSSTSELSGFGGAETRECTDRLSVRNFDNHRVSEK